MTDKLPPPLLALFQPRPPLRYLPPSDRAPDDCQKSTISGVAQFLADAKTFADEVPYNATESWVQRKLRQKIEKKERLEKQIADGLQNCTICLLFKLFSFRRANKAISYSQSRERSSSSR
jgi:U1 small nuclear ribonucleoprotein